MEDAAKVPLRNQKHEIIGYALIDADDASRVMKLSWHLSNDGYCIAAYKTSEKKWVHVRMHRFIMNAAHRTIVDHINNERRDNRKSNLRVVSASANSQNRESKLKHGRKFFGVCCPNGTLRAKPWRAQIGKQVIGVFQTEEEAAYAYDCRAKELHGVHARVNGVEKPSDFQEPAVRRRISTTVAREDGILLKGLTQLHSSQTFRISMSINRKPVTRTYRTREEALSAYYALKQSAMVPTSDAVLIPRDENGVALLPTTNTFVRVDDDTYLKYCNQTCNVNHEGYPVVTVNGAKTLLHRLVANAKADEIVDHIDRDKSNATNCNLRIVSSSVNGHNKTKALKCASRYHGVTQKAGRVKFTVYVSKDGIRYSGGSYYDEKLAAWAANCLSRDLYNEFAVQNDIVLEKPYVWQNKRAVLQDDANLATFKRQRLI